MEKKLGYFKDLYQKGQKFELLEWLYLGITILFVFIAGMIALLNQSFGVGLLVIPLISFVAFLANYVSWSLINTIAGHSTKTENKDKEKKSK